MDPNHPSNFHPSGHIPPYIPSTPSSSSLFGSHDTPLQPSFYTYTDPPLAYPTPPYTFGRQQLYPGHQFARADSSNEQLARIIAVKQEELGRVAMTDNMEGSSSRYVLYSSLRI